MADFTRTLFRQGPNSDRRNVILQSGEPAYVTDYKRVVIGDGITPGGNSIGVRFLGFTEFDAFSSEVNNVLPGIPGDIMFCNTTNLLYVLSGTRTILGKEAYQIQSNYTPINKTPNPDEITISSNGGTVLSLVLESIDGRYLAGYSLGRGLSRNASNSGIIEMALPGDGLGFVDNVLSITDGGVSLTKIQPMRANQVLATLGEGGSPKETNLQEFADALRIYLQGNDTTGSLGVPVGTIIDYAGAKPPINYLPCDGRELSIESYPELFSAINYTWGQPSLTSFNLPNLNKRTTIGQGDVDGSTGSNETISSEIGSYGGAAQYQLRARQLPQHQHGITFTLPAHTHNFEYILPEFTVQVPGGVFTTGNIIKSGYDNYVNIILSQAAAPLSYPRGPVDLLTNTRADAANILSENKPQIQLNTVQFVKSTYPIALSAVTMSGSDALSAKCYRDTGYIVDSIIADLRNNANHRSIETGLLYFSGYITQNKNLSSTVPALPQNQVNPTIEAIKAIGSIITGYNIPLSSTSTSSGLLSSQIFYTPEQRKVVDSFRIFIDVINNKNNTPVTKPNGVLPGDEGPINLSNDITSLRSTLQTGVTAFVNSNYPEVFDGNLVLSQKCYRDTGYMIDAIAADLKNNANHRSVEVGNAYFTGAVLLRASNPGSSVPTLPQDQVEPTIAAIRELNRLIKELTTIVPSEYSLDRLDWLTDTIIYPLENEGLIVDYEPAGSITSSDIRYSEILTKEKVNIQNRVTNYVIGKKYLPAFSDNLIKCRRDVGYMVDALIRYFDTGCDARLVQYAVAYWDGSTSRLPENLISNQVKNTIDTIEFLKNIVLEILGLSKEGIHGQVLDLINTMVYPLQNRGKSLAYIPAGNPTTDDLFAADVLQANRTSIQAKIAAYVNRLGIIRGDAVLESKCNRDVGYMIDSVIHTLRTGVNARTIQYALAYWDGAVNRIDKPGVRGDANRQIPPTIQTIRELSRETIKVLLNNGGGQNETLTVTSSTSAGGNVKLYETTDDSSLDILKNEFISNLQPSAVVNKCIKAR